MNMKRLIQNIRYNLHFKSSARGDYCKKKDIFKYTGENVRLPAMILPLYPKLMTFHNNIEVASGVRFVVHDAIHDVVNNDGSGMKQEENMGEIEIFDNVFVGAGTIILPGVKIGPNAIIGAGSVVNRDVPENSVCVGVPARKIETYEEYVRKNASRKDS